MALSLGMKRYTFMGVVAVSAILIALCVAPVAAVAVNNTSFVLPKTMTDQESWDKHKAILVRYGCIDDIYPGDVVFAPNGNYVECLPSGEIKTYYQEADPNAYGNPPADVVARAVTKAEYYDTVIAPRLGITKKTEIVEEKSAAVVIPEEPIQTEVMIINTTPTPTTEPTIDYSLQITELETQLAEQQKQIDEQQGILDTIWKMLSKLIIGDHSLTP